MSRKIMLVVFLVGCLMAVSAEAAMDDVIIWDSIRTQGELEDTLVNGYSSNAGMRLWWDFNDPANLGKSVAPRVLPDATIFGNASSLATETPFTSYAGGGLAASGFNTVESMIAVDPQLWDITGDGTPTYGGWDQRAYYTDRTYEMWVRNPHLGGQAVFFSITAGTYNILGGGDDDVKRMWVNDDGSITMADRGSLTAAPQGIASYTSDPLTWDTNAWYQISVVFDYTDNDYHDMRVYRGKQGDSQIESLLDYESSSFSSVHVLAVGGHQEGFGAYAETVGAAGFLGEDTYVVPEPFTMVLLAAGGLMTLRKKRR